MKALYLALTLTLATAACASADGGAATLKADTELASDTGVYKVRAVPVAPVKRGANDFSVQVVIPQGAKVVGATAFMPAHGHSSDPPSITQAADGSFRVDHLVLFMGGRWEITLSVAGGAKEDQVRFGVDVP